METYRIIESRGELPPPTEALKVLDKLRLEERLGSELLEALASEERPQSR